MSTASLPMELTPQERCGLAVSNAFQPLTGLASIVCMTAHKAFNIITVRHLLIKKPYDTPQKKDLRARAGETGKDLIGVALFPISYLGIVLSAIGGFFYPLDAFVCRSSIVTLNLSKQFYRDFAKEDRLFSGSIVGKIALLPVVTDLLSFPGSLVRFKELCTSCSLWQYARSKTEMV